MKHKNLLEETIKKTYPNLVKDKFEIQEAEQNLNIINSKKSTPDTLLESL